MLGRPPTFLSHISLPLLLVILAACEKTEERPPFLNVPTTNGAAGGGNGKDVSLSNANNETQVEELYPWCSNELVELDTSELCDDQTAELGSARPNLYFVLDTSGSMAGRIGDAQSDSLLEASRQAIFDLVSELGDSLNYGIATYPGELEPEDFGCALGAELVAPLKDEDYCEGPSVEVQFKANFRRQLNLLTPDGGSPLSPTLRSLEEQLLGLKGTTTIVLLTDGAPNCNGDTTCALEDCLLAEDFNRCGPSGNCCSAEATSAINPTPGSWCVDEDSSIAIVEKLAAEGVETRVIGIPGAQEYEPLMNALAVAGGATRTAEAGEEQGYFDVANPGELLEALRTIGQGAATSCDIELDAIPIDQSLINVYVNNRLIDQDSKNGWEISGKTVRLQGDSCMILREGGVRNVRVVVGCPTIIR